MSTCYNCNQTGHIKKDCPTKANNGDKKRCYDCNNYVSDLKAHRKDCANSRHAHSVINTSNPRAPTPIPTTTNSLCKTYPDFYFLIDVSGSMEGARLANAKECARVILAKMNPMSRIAIITFDTKAFFKLKPRPVEEIIRKSEMEPILARIFAQGLTAIYDAIDLGIGQLHDKNKKTMMFVLTDGEDNSSRISYEALLAKTKEYPNVYICIVHIDGASRPNANYAKLCSQQNGHYKQITEGCIITEVTSSFDELYG